MFSDADLVLSTTASLDYEATTYYELILIATDGVNLAATGTITVTILDRFDSYPVITNLQTEENTEPVAVYIAENQLTPIAVFEVRLH